MNSGGLVSVSASAGKPHRPKFDTPESVVVCAEYPEDFLAVFSINYAAMKYQSRNDQLNQLDGDCARLDVGREDLKLFQHGAGEVPAQALKSERGFAYATDLHVANFLACVRSRKQPTAPIALGFQSTLVLQMANLSLRNGRRVSWNANGQEIEL